nr:MAG TPA: hypothetical protein [Caudoviricetes sp.]
MLPAFAFPLRILPLSFFHSVLYASRRKSSFGTKKIV